MATFQKRDKKWRAIVRKSGHRHISKTFRTRAAAKRWAQEQEDSIELRQFIDPRVCDVTTISDLIDRYLDEFEPNNTKRCNLGKVKASIGKYSLTEFKSSHIVAHCRQRRRDGIEPATVMQDVNFLDQVLRIARNYWKIPSHSDPVAEARMILRMPYLDGRPMIDRAVERDRRPTKAEIKKLREYFAALPRQQIPMVDLIDFDIATAWRVGEICRVKWDDLDVKNRTIIIRDRKDPRNKYGNNQEVPLLGDAWTILMRQPNGDERIFPFNTKSISTAFTRACRKLGIKNLRFHDLRHEGTSRLFEAGYQIQEVALCTGHKDWRMLARYTQLKAKDLHR